MDPAEAPKVEPSGMGTLITWLEINKTRVLVIAAAVGIVALATVLYLRHESERENRASFALSEIRVPLNPAAAPPAGVAESYLKVADEYQGSQAAPRALLMAAGVLFVEGKYAEAQKNFERTMREYPGNPWSAQASLGVAKSVDALKNIPEAITRYEDVRKRFANTAASDEATLGLARMYELQNKNEQAIRLYHELSQSSSSSIGTRAGFRKEVLVDKYPELTNAIAPIMPAPTALPMPGVTNMAGSPMIRSNVTPVMNPPPGGSIVPYRLPEPAMPPTTPPPATTAPSSGTPTPGTPNTTPAPASTPGGQATPANDSAPSTPNPGTPKTEPAPAVTPKP